MRPSKLYRSIFSCATLVAAFANVHAAEPDKAAPGGKGSMIAGVIETCIKSGSVQVPEVCGRVQVNWKLWTLMGEPIGDFVLGWKLTRLRIANAEGSGSTSYQTSYLPAALGKAAQHIEMYVDGIAYVRKASLSGNYNTAVMAFNTGVPTKPGTTSINVPGGYDWNNFLQGRLSSRAAIGPGAWCVTEGRGQLSAEEAKAIMRAGVQLDGLELCPTSTVDVSPVERAINKLCGTATDSPPRFCPKQTNTASAVKQRPARNAIDDAFSALDGGKDTDSAAPSKTAVGRKKTRASDPITAAFDAAEVERAQREQLQRERDAATARLAEKTKSFTVACSAAKAQQAACSSNSCGTKPRAEICTDEREKLTHCDASPGGSCLNIPVYTCYAHGPNPKLAEWQTCSAKLAKGCAEHGAPIASVEQCVADRMKASK